MKELIKKSIVLALVFAALQGNATVNPKLQNLKDGKTTVLTLSGAEQGDVLYIKDVTGEVMYEQAISTTGEFVRAFNLTSYHKGSYYFEVIPNNNGDAKRVPFRVINHKIEFGKNIDSSDKKLKKTKKSKRAIVKAKSSPKRVEIEKGVQRRIPSFKGQNFIEYYKLNR